MNNPLFLIPVLTGVVFLLVGFLMKRFLPKKINRLYGYRVSNSMKSQERWDFAQAFASKEMTKTGGVLVLLFLIGW